jgi:hypothetical protein
MIQPAVASEARVDVAIAFYGKPNQTLVALRSLLHHSRSHLGTIYLTHERRQPHGQTAALEPVLRQLASERLVVHRPTYFYELGPLDEERVRTDSALRWSLPYQYALEKTDKAFLFVLHNDMLFHADLVGALLEAFDAAPGNLAGAGSIGQCWVCPAAKNGKCYGAVYDQYVPGAEEAIALHQRYPPPRLDLDLDIIRSGRVHPLPECRLNEYAALLHVPTYRAHTLPQGSAHCFGGVWDGADLGTRWFYDMVNQGRKFHHVFLEEFARHSPFNATGQGIGANTQAEQYHRSEAEAAEYLARHFPPTPVPLAARLRTALRLAGLRARRWGARVYAGMHRRFRDLRVLLPPTF